MKLVLVGVLLVHGALVLGPPVGGFRLPLASRLLYLHVPLAIAAYGAWGVALVAALRGLRVGHTDERVVHACGAAAALALGSLLSGLVWSAEFLGYNAWTDPKVIATAVLVAQLAGVVAAHRAGAAPRVPSALALVGIVTVPGSYLASRVSVHPEVLATGEVVGAVAAWLWPAMVGGLLVGLGWALAGQREVRVDE